MGRGMCVVEGGQGLGRALMPDVFVVGHEWPTYAGGRFGSGTVGRYSLPNPL